MLAIILIVIWYRNKPKITLDVDSIPPFRSVPGNVLGKAQIELCLAHRKLHVFNKSIRTFRAGPTQLDFVWGYPELRILTNWPNVSNLFAKFSNSSVALSFCLSLSFFLFSSQCLSSHGEGRGKEGARERKRRGEETERREGEGYRENNGRKFLP